ncbi:MAG TPA: hypothetical protein VH968_04785 [Gaiellaceae bacterium]|jgi:hypothetical protein
MSIIDSIKRFFERQSDATHDPGPDRVDSWAATKDFDQSFDGAGNSGIPPNYLPTGVDEGRPKK